MKKAIVFLASILWAGSLFAMPALVGAQTVDDTYSSDFGISDIQGEIGLGSDDPRVTAARIIRTGLGFLGLVAVVIVLWGGIMWMTSGGTEDRAKSAKKILYSGVIGLIIILSAFALSSFVINQLAGSTGFTSAG